MLRILHCLCTLCVGGYNGHYYTFRMLNIRLLFFSLTDLREVDILVGTNDWQSGGTRYKMYVFIPHQQCSNIFKLEGEPQYQYDIALIRIDGKIKFDETVKPIEYSKEFIKPGTQLRMFGWESVSLP